MGLTRETRGRTREILTELTSFPPNSWVRRKTRGCTHEFGGKLVRPMYKTETEKREHIRQEWYRQAPATGVLGFEAAYVIFKDGNSGGSVPDQLEAEKARQADAGRIGVDVPAPATEDELRSRIRRLEWQETVNQAALQTQAANSLAGKPVYHRRTSAPGEASDCADEDKDNTPDGKDLKQFEAHVGMAVGTRPPLGSHSRCVSRSGGGAFA